MKKVFLSLAMIAALTVVSCKNNEEKPAEDATTTEEVAPVEEAAPAADTAAAPAADTTAAPATEAPAAAPAK